MWIDYIHINLILDAFIKYRYNIINFYEVGNYSISTQYHYYHYIVKPLKVVDSMDQLLALLQIDSKNYHYLQHYFFDIQLFVLYQRC